MLGAACLSSCFSLPLPCLSSWPSFLSWLEEVRVSILAAPASSRSHVARRRRRWCWPWAVRAGQSRAHVKRREQRLLLGSVRLDGSFNGACTSSIVLTFALDSVALRAFRWPKWRNPPPEGMKKPTEFTGDGLVASDAEERRHIVVDTSTVASRSAAAWRIDVRSLGASGGKGAACVQLLVLARAFLQRLVVVTDLHEAHPRPTPNELAPRRAAPQPRRATTASNLRT